MSNHDFIDAADAIRVEFSRSHLPYVASALTGFLSAEIEGFGGVHSRDAVQELQSTINRYAAWLEAIEWGEPDDTNRDYVLVMPRRDAERLGSYLAEVDSSEPTVERLHEVIGEAEAAIAVLAQLGGEGRR